MSFEAMTQALLSDKFPRLIHSYNIWWNTKQQFWSRLYNTHKVRTITNSSWYSMVSLNIIVSITPFSRSLIKFWQQIRWTQHSQVNSFEPVRLHSALTLHFDRPQGISNKVMILTCEWCQVKNQWTQFRWVILPCFKPLFEPTYYFTYYHHAWF